MPNEAAVHTNKPAGTYRLQSAILIYGNGSSEPGAHYATLHGVSRQGKAGLQLEPGVPATAAGCATFVRSIADRAAFSGFVQSRMLYIGPRVVAWWRAPAPARVWFDAKHDDPSKHIGQRNAKVPHPGLVFTLADGHWYVHAVKGDKRPHQDTPLRVAPYFNVSESGWICEGNIKRPARVTPETIDEFETAFFNSVFTHPNIHRAGRFAIHKGGPYAFWRWMLGRADDPAMPFDRFPEHVLVNVKLTLAQHIKQLESKKHAD
jgi:PRTRC genetic system protein B